jgi:hypothetical protein
LLADLKTIAELEAFDDDLLHAGSVAEPIILEVFSFAGSEIDLPISIKAII